MARKLYEEVLRIETKFLISCFQPGQPTGELSLGCVSRTMIVVHHAVRIKPPLAVIIIDTPI